MSSCSILIELSGAAWQSLPIRPIAALNDIRAGSPHVLVVEDAEQELSDTGLASSLARFVREGGKVLLLHPRSQLPRLFPAQVTGYHAARPARS